MKKNILKATLVVAFALIAGMNVYNCLLYTSCDTLGALGSTALLTHPHVRCMQVSTGRTRQACDRLSEKVLANLSEYNG